MTQTITEHLRHLIQTTTADFPIFVARPSISAALELPLHSDLYARLFPHLCFFKSEFVCQLTPYCEGLAYAYDDPTLVHVGLGLASTYDTILYLFFMQDTNKLACMVRINDADTAHAHILRRALLYKPQ